MTQTRPVEADGARDEFARIDLVSNHTLFNGDEPYKALLLGRDLPVQTFSSFIPEARTTGVSCRPWGRRSARSTSPSPQRPSVARSLATTRASKRLE